MKNVLLVAVLATSVAFSASAMPSEIDTDGDGLASLVELQDSNPDLTQEMFTVMDAYGAGFVNDEEMLVAIELGTLVDPDKDL